MLIQQVELGDRSYRILIGPKLLKDIGSLLSKLGLSQTLMLVSNPKVFSLYGQQVVDSLADEGFQVFEGIIPDGEQYKSLSSANDLYDLAIKAGLDRKSAIVALGGGVVGDLAGFVAATYMRGVPFIQVPTTLLAQVDSSIGGKVAVNHPLGKNMIGCFYQPRLVVADTDALTTLPDRELRAGMAEVIKYGIIKDAGFFTFLEDKIEAALNLDPEVTEQIVFRSCQIKAEIVAADERDEGIRAILNYGHTIGHALETLTGYEQLLHGEAVAIGMVQAARIATILGYLSEHDLDKIARLTARAKLETAIPSSVSTEEIIEAMMHDKKTVDKNLTFILPTKIGKVIVEKGLTISRLADIL